MRSLFHAVALVTALFGASAANAGILYQSATLGSHSTGDYPIVGDGTSANSRFIGARFTLSSASHITGVGADFDLSGGGPIFAAIVKLASPSAFPSVAPADLASIALAHVLLTPPSIGGDVLAALSTDLAAGNYAIVFGSGLFGATSFASLRNGNDNVGSPSLFQSLYGNDYLSQPADGLRIVVEGQAVPEPSSALLLIGAGGLLLLARRRAH